MPNSFVYKASILSTDKSNPSEKGWKKFNISYTYSICYTFLRICIQNLFIFYFIIIIIIITIIIIISIIIIIIIISIIIIFYNSLISKVNRV